MRLFIYLALLVPFSALAVSPQTAQNSADIADIHEVTPSLTDKVVLQMWARWFRRAKREA